MLLTNRQIGLVLESVEQEIPSWGAVCKLMLLVQPSNAAAERGFSTLDSKQNPLRTMYL